MTTNINKFVDHTCHWFLNTKTPRLMGRQKHQGTQSMPNGDSKQSPVWRHIKAGRLKLRLWKLCLPSTPNGA